jgi:polysaccharide export outer membrane protein
LDQAAKKPRHFDMIEIDGRVVSTLASQPKPSLRSRFESYGKPPSPTIGIGDTVSVSIWQAGIAPRQTTPESEAAQGGRPVTIPDQVVGADGAISVPYAGRVPVAGRTPLQVQTAINQRLAEQAVQPQSIVTVAKTVSDSVTVSGEQVGGARVPLSVGGDRLLDVIAAAGGSRSPTFETSVRLFRHDETATIPMSTLVTDPEENIYAWPGDVITLIQTPETFSVFGATFSNTQVKFGADRLDLAQAIAKAGGLLDGRADPSGVFLFRFESPAVVKAVGAPELGNGSRGNWRGNWPVVYHLNLREVDSFFLAQRFAIRDNDLVYVANAPMTELQKFFTLIGTITGPVITGVVVTRGVTQ